ncbi:DNA cytosine methyltransferase [Calothrix sp. 336/3]|uniref:DNA cytosine methyltransferase n=1 Tax=Calothrix sp. 336/3 TaxID=1337936 RepID=UPI000624937E|nr:DNA cytosine methyltransferase [Calothrix sp. 336/3]AKG21298.1 DNA methyltransferase [Calothrix sp. 336/3]
MMSKNKKLVVSLFCGIGGLDLGFKSAGFEVAVAIDNNPKVLELYRLNFPDTTVLCRDIGEISASEIREIIQYKYPDWDGEIAAVIGGPPCQGFSVAGKQDVNDKRSQLVLKFINLVVELNPSMFVMENVPAIEWKKFAGITENAIARVEEHYILSKWLLTASDFGVPQKRQRAIWVGSKFGEIAAPVGSEKKFNVGDAIADLTHLPINSHVDTWELSQKGEYAEYLDKIFTSTRLSDHPGASKPSNRISGCRATSHTAATQRKYGDTLPGEKEPTTWAKRLSADGFSPTLRAGSGNRTAARPIHYEHTRVITVREAARLQSFPDWFNFGPSKLAAHKAIGNSVPPLLAYAIAQALTSQFASQVWTHLEEQQNISFGDSTRTTIVLRCPETGCFVFRYLLDLQTLEASVDLRLFYSMGQQSGKQNCGTSGLVDGDNIKVGSERSPPGFLKDSLHEKLPEMNN